MPWFFCMYTAFRMFTGRLSVNSGASGDGEPGGP
jgi:hypothetical protein